MNIILLGPAGSGKSTQAKLLSKELGIPTLSAGDLLYYSSLESTQVAQEIKEKMEKGELIDHEQMVKLLEEHLKQKEHGKGTIIDGFPRNVIEAKMFKVPIDLVVYIKVSDQEVTKRLKIRGRHDDTPEVIANRIRIYHQETEPVLDYYRSLGILQEINGEQSIQQIAAEIRKIRL